MTRALAGLTVAAVLLGSGSLLAQQAGTPGQFDYYILSLSWAPQFCATGGDSRSPAECAANRPYGFILHGLWPQFAKGGYPQACSASAAVPAAVIEDMMPVMPGAALIQHEWEKHGTCSGLTMPAYFKAAKTAFASISIPGPYRQPAAIINTSARQLAAEFQAVNPGLEPAAVAVVCKKQFLAELRLCLTRDLKPQPCGASVREACGAQIVLRPVRPGGS